MTQTRFDLSFTPEQDAVVEVASAVAAGLIDGAAREADATGTIPDRVWSGLLELGLTTPVDEEHGGGGVPDAISQLLAIERLAHGDPGITAAATWSGNAALLVGLCGTPEQRRTVLPDLLTDASRRGACALYEGFGRAPSELATTFTEHGNGWRVSGRKVAVPFAASADPTVLIGTDARDRRLRAAIVPSGGGGFLVDAATTPCLALRAAATASVEYDLVVTDDQLLGGPAADPDELARVIARVRLSTGAMLVGCAQRAMEYASQYAVERIAFSRPIAALQGVSFMMAEARMQLDATRLELWAVASSIERAPVRDLERAVTRAVTYAGSVATSVTRDAVQVLGGHGFISDHPVERWYRSAAVLSTVDFDPLCVPFAAAL